MISASLGPLAQLVEQEAFNLCVISSNLIRPTIYTPTYYYVGWAQAHQTNHRQA